MFTHPDNAITWKQPSTDLFLPITFLGNPNWRTKFILNAHAVLIFLLKTNMQHKYMIAGPVLLFLMLYSSLVYSPFLFKTTAEKPELTPLSWVFILEGESGYYCLSFLSSLYVFFSFAFYVFLTEKCTWSIIVAFY